ncbi:cytochrome c [Phenylobacterium sp.]|uniref:c-type cytochrome n=1 Tax=Phenylobacterium sp. TaxID=1871053 RepID=UPI00286D87DA|nr:cytochrome c [Phenylobacterium sp.]
MARPVLILAALLGGALIAAQASAQDAATDASADRGRDLVLKHCSRCHSLAPTGPSSEPSAPPFRDLHKRYPVENLGEALAEGILVGHPQMPEFRFGPDDVTAVIDYLNRIQSGTAKPSP